MATYRIERHDSEYAGTILSGIEADSEEEAIENFIIDNIETDWITRIQIVGVKLLPDHLQKKMEFE